MKADVWKKLRYKEGQAAAVVHAPEGLTPGAEFAQTLEGKLDFALAFAHNLDEARARVPGIIPHLNEDAVFWIAYPKQSSKIKTDINRDTLWKLVEELTSYRAVSNVAINDTWSAVRFRHTDKVKK